MSDEPPLKKRPVWNAQTTVEPKPKVSGSSSVACWLSVFVNGSVLTRVAADAGPAAISPSADTQIIRLVARRMDRSLKSTVNREDAPWGERFGAASLGRGQKRRQRRT